MLLLKRRFHGLIWVACGIFALVLLTDRKQQTELPFHKRMPNASSVASPESAEKSPAENSGAAQPEESVSAKPALPEIQVASDPEQLAELKMENPAMYFHVAQREQHMRDGLPLASPATVGERREAARERVQERLVRYLESHKKSN